MANEPVFDRAKSLGALAADFIHVIKEAGVHPQSGVGGGALHRLERRLMGIEDLPAQAALDLAEQAMLDGMPFGGIGRVVGNAQAQAESSTQLDQDLP